MSNTTTTNQKDDTNDFYKNAFLSMLHTDESNKEDKASELGLWRVWAYHCIRCNYVWFPRFLSGYHPMDYEELLFNREPPKSYARCKSKYWNKIPQRETK